MIDGFFERAIDALMNYGLCLPLTLCAESRKRHIRMLGLLWFVGWCWPAFAVLGIPLLVCFFGWIIEDTWRGTL